jgi:meiotically up-regulated gene 157 (Mug157) protein
VKPSSGNAYQGITSDSLFYIGDLDIDVSNSTCLDKELTFSCAYLEGMAIDGDTIYAMLNPPANYSGASFDFEYDGAGTYTITGDFDVVSLFTQTNFLYDVCLDCASSTIDCMDLSNYDDQYVNSVGFDDVTYPIGSAFITNGDIQYVKPSSGNSYQAVVNNELFYIGDLDIDVSTSTCANKVLTFSCAYLEGLSVDGDSVFTMLNAPAYFDGGAWEFETDGVGSYTITGDFDVVSLFSQTNTLFDVCLDCEPVSVIQCMNLSNYDDQYINSVGFDDVTYPIGSAFITSGDIRYVKPSSGNSYQAIVNNELFYIGDLDIDVSTSTCANKVLTFSCAYLEGLSVDGDTVFTMLNAPAYFDGGAWEFETDGTGSYTITGDFDVVSLFSQTNTLFDVCLDCDDVVSVNEIPTMESNYTVYPNPTNGTFTINSMNTEGFSFTVYDTNGGLIISNTSINSDVQIDLSNYNDGLYLISVIDSNGFRSVKKLVKN